MSSLNCSILVHTFNKYEHFWPGYLKGFHENVHWNLPPFFGTDEPDHSPHDFNDFKVIYSGRGEWGARLINLLHQIPTDFVVYCQEDMWPFAHPPVIEKMMRFMVDLGLYRLQIAPVNQFYSLHGSSLPLFFHNHPKSKYLVNHQPAIWLKSFLLECLRPDEDPWKNEYQGSLRLNQRTDLSGKLAIYPCNWFQHVGIKGKLVTDAKAQQMPGLQ